MCCPAAGPKQAKRLVRDLPEGGQGHTYVVERSDGSDPRKYVLKRLKNPKRKDYFEREIRACLALDHPNVLKILQCGQTPAGKPYLITDYCENGSLEELPAFKIPVERTQILQSDLQRRCSCT